MIRYLSARRIRLFILVGAAFPPGRKPYGLEAAAISSVSQIAMIAAESRSHLFTFSTTHLLPSVLCLLTSVICPLISDT